MCNVKGEQAYINIDKGRYIKNRGGVYRRYFMKWTRRLTNLFCYIILVLYMRTIHVYILSLIFVLSFQASLNLAFAQTETTDNTTAISVTDENTTTSGTSATSVTSDKQSLAEDKKAEKEAKMQEIQQKIEEKKAEVLQKREEFKAKVQEIQDQKKKEIVERIDVKMKSANQKRTSIMSSALEKMNLFIERIQEKVNRAKESGQDTTEIEILINTAQSAIANAEQLVVAQAGKEYVITITDETKLHDAVKPIVDALKVDLKNTHNIVREAKEAVVEVAKGYGILKVNYSNKPE